MLDIRTGAIAFEDELLFCELACVAQAINNHLIQQGFETSLLSVLGTFFHGLGNGRMIQARFDTSGVLRVRASPIYSFQDTDSPFWRLFLRYYACNPYYGQDAEFAEDKDESGYVPSDTGSRLSSSVPAGGPKKRSQKHSQALRRRGEYTGPVALAGIRTSKLTTPEIPRVVDNVYDFELAEGACTSRTALKNGSLHNDSVLQFKKHHLM
ncbi:Uncharacterized protein PECH_001964 [Penicillium ucsense]|uniref:Uncharacterized protein n=1 Tax=Penicillium ucsense TaxID=2839758 RepID=A0A8J8WFG1_9EURO|nr:Uncharacterized protein PECM_008830 [Penicillium ucsense]KAF7731363.1 Uncharacterized protein PECH_001964 [Penicillium ucsense]